MVDKGIGNVYFDASNVPFRENPCIGLGLAIPSQEHSDDTSNKFSIVKSKSPLIEANKIKKRQTMPTTYTQSRKSEDTKKIMISRRDALNAFSNPGSIKALKSSVTLNVTKRGNLFNYEEALHNDNSKKEKIKRFFKNYIDHNAELLIMSILTIFCLFAPDFQHILISMRYDDIFNSCYIFIFTVFMLEFLISIWVKPSYANSFFFWIDLLATLSMLLEADWILTPLVNLILK